MEPASIRTKNPGAMWPGAVATKWGSKTFISLNDGTGQGNKIAVFDDWVSGICAQIDLWRGPKYKNKQFADAINTWDGGNNTPSYIALVKVRVPGMTEDTVMDEAFWHGPMAVPFLKTQAFHEAGKTYPAPDVDWLTAMNKVLGAAPVEVLLYFSCSGEEVKTVQRKLGLVVDGKFGYNTTKAVIAFQITHGGLPVHGIVGPLTWNALTALGGPQ